MGNGVTGKLPLVSATLVPGSVDQSSTLGLARSTAGAGVTLRVECEEGGPLPGF